MMLGKHLRLLTGPGAATAWLAGLVKRCYGHVLTAEWSTATRAGPAHGATFAMPRRPRMVASVVTGPQAWA